jgi:hypothetical protein
MSAADKNSRRSQQERAKEPPDAQSKLEAPLRAHFCVWFFMIALSVSPLLYLLGMRESVGREDWGDAVAAVVLIQGMLWIAQGRCSSEDLSYWEGLLVAAASTITRPTGIGLISFVLALPVMLLTVASSFLFALTHDGSSPLRHASIRFSRLIIGIHKRRLYR